MPPKSQITGGITGNLFTCQVLGKHAVTYYRCAQTGFIQTEKPYWLDEAYSNAITALDLGLASRNWTKADVTESVISKCMPESSSYLDFGGGYGIFTRLMRDRGYAFEHFDIYCKNLFSVNHQLKELETKKPEKFDLVTAWEVFEHVSDPKLLVEELLSVADAILFSTELVPNKTISSADDWWYFTPETGQHVSFYTKKSLEVLANQNGATFYTDGRCNHLMTKKALSKDPFSPLDRTFLTRVRERLCQMLLPNNAVNNCRNSLLEEDFQRALRELRERQRTDALED